MADWKNKLYFGDNLDIMREYIDDESVDLIYLDPPFNSKANYNVLFGEANGTKSEAQITVFEDTWHWGQDSENIYHEIVKQGPKKLSDLICTLRSFLGTNDMMAYLTMMAPRLVELRRVLKPTGSIYLHCDPTASHYLKLVMDSVFGFKNYRNEIIWQRTLAGKPIYRNLPRNSDVIFWFTKSDNYYFDPILVPLSEEDKATFNLDDGDGRGRYNTQPIINPADRPNLKYIYTDLKERDWNPPKTGWRFNQERMHQLELEGRLVFGKTSIREKYYLSEREKKGKQLSNIWSDIPIVGQDERLGYPTQKPEALLERIIRASSNEGDIVMDPFCGCGTTIAVSERLKRKWIGIDITHLAITLMKHRLEDTFKTDLSKYEVIGDPKDLHSAIALSEQNKYQFEWWALGLVDARPVHDKKKGADTGIDGYIYFFDDDTNKAKSIILSVKGGHVTVSQIRDLKGVVEREKACIGVFITLVEPTRPMKEEAISAGFYEPAFFPDTRYPRIQIITIEELLNGGQIEYPRLSSEVTFKKAKRKYKKDSGQIGIF
ncbi:MAG: DNA methyltransferase [Bacillota bacterium]|nr:DNA methyltransferase [Bacillota bacterium]